MKYLVILFFSLPLFISSQYSDYYSGAYSNPQGTTLKAKVDVNQKVQVSGHITQTVTSIDYGSLAKANAERERTRLLKEQFLDEKSKREAIDIASDPLKAFEYGEFRNVNYYSSSDKRKKARNFGFKKCRFYYNEPHKSLFNSTGNGRWENVSSEEITTEYYIYLVSQVRAEEAKNFDLNQAEKILSFEKFKTGQLNKGNEGDFYLHKKDLNRAMISNQRGFKGTMIWEDNYEYTITDTYLAIWQNNEGKWFKATAKARYLGDKDKVTFEDLEGRRHYLHTVIEKVISSARIYDEIPIEGY